MSSLDLLGGRLALDFVNTVEPREGASRVDFLPDYAALVAFGVHTEQVSGAIARQVLRAAAADSTREAIWRRALALREALYRIFRAVALAEAVQPADLRILSDENKRMEDRARLVARRSRPLGTTGPALGWVWPEAVDLERPLWPLTVSAVEVLTREDCSRLRICPHGEWGCGWIFFDDSRNRSRRWCSMRDCGTRSKARRLTDRRRARRR